MKLRSLLLAAFLLVTLPLASSFAQVGVSINIAPPVLPVVEQPPVPAEGYIWTPAYWAWGDDGYYLVPGAWVAPPSVGLLWTPPWWGWNNGVYVFNEGYWGPTVGFYGGINYGHGYWGDGYWGGRWQGNAFVYNTAVTHVDKTVIHNTYVDKTVVNKEVNRSRASFNGPNGVKAEPTAEQKTAAEHKVPATSQQVSRQEAAAKDRNLHASVNHGHPSPQTVQSFNKAQEGVGAAGAGAGKAETGTGNVSEHRGQGTENLEEHGNKHEAEDLHGNKHEHERTVGGPKAHTGKATGYGGPAHGPYQMNQKAYHPQTGTYHPAAGGGGNHPNKPQPKQQQQGKKKPGEQ